MRTRIGLLAAVSAVAVSMATMANAAVVGIIPVTASSGSVTFDPFQCAAYYDLARAFDAQAAGGVTWDGTKPVTTAGTDLPAPGCTYAQQVRQFGWGYVDFGADYSNIRISGTWTRLHSWVNPDANQEAMWWDNSLTNTTGTDFTGTYGLKVTFQVPNQTANLETTLKFRTIGNISGNDGIWTNNWAAATDADAVTPMGRYLIIKAPGNAAGGGNGGEPQAGSAVGQFMEYAFVGSVVPEPTSMALLGLGALALLHRRKK